MTDGNYINGSPDWRRLVPLIGLMITAYALGISFYLQQQWLYAGVCGGVGAVHTYLIFQTRVFEK